LSDEVIENVSKLIKQVEAKQLTKLMQNGYRALKQGFTSLVNILRKLRVR